MMHAADYSKMNEMDVKANLNYSKCKDKQLQLSLKYVKSSIFYNHYGCYSCQRIIPKYLTFSMYVMMNTTLISELRHVMEMP